MSQQTIRPYIMALYTLQDEFITLLKGINAEGKGFIQEPEMVIKDDKTQELKFSIPMYLSENGKLIENPIWYTTQDGALMRGMRKVKVIFGSAIPEVTNQDVYAVSSGNTLFIEGVRLFPYVHNEAHEYENKQTIPNVPHNAGLFNYLSSSSNKLEIFEFIITKVSEEHKEGVLTCKVEAQGLAFQELGKSGYKIALNQDTFDLDYKAYFDGIISAINPFKDYSGLQIDEQDSSGHSLDLTFTNYNEETNQFDATESAFVELLFDSPTKVNETYVLNFFCTENLNTNITWSYDKNHRFNLDYENIVELNFIESVESIKIYFNKNNQNEIPVIGSFSLKQKNEVVCNIDYWVKKVLNGTNWTYSVRTDWSSHDGVIVENYDKMSNAARKAINIAREENTPPLRRMDKIYEDPYVSNWTEEGDPAGYIKIKEKARIIDCKESNRFNILQTIAEKFEINTKFVYHYDDFFRITGREVVFYNNVIKDNDVFEITYPYDTNDIVRKMDCQDIVTKMYVKTIQDDTNLLTGQISITDAEANLSKEEYILNFDYLYDIGTISKDQYDAIKPYELKMRKFNIAMERESVTIAMYSTSLAQQKGLLSSCKTSIRIANDEIKEANEKIQAILGKDGILEKQSNPEAYALVINNKATIHNSGVLKETVKVYSDVGKTIDVGITKIDVNKDYADVYINNPNGEIKTVYFTYSYKPTLYYANIVTEYTELLNNKLREKEVIENLVKEYNEKIAEAQSKLNKLIEDKQKEIQKFERMMGPAIREGSWQDDKYTNNGNRKTKTVSDTEGDYGECRYDYEDEIAFEGEQKAYFDYSINKKQYYYYVDAPMDVEPDSLFLCYDAYWMRVEDYNEDTEIWNSNKVYNRGDYCHIGNNQEIIFQCLKNNCVNQIPGLTKNINYLGIGSKLIPAVLKVENAEPKVVLLIDDENIYIENNTDFINKLEQGSFVSIESTLILDENGAAQYMALPTKNNKIELNSNIEVHQIDSEKDKVVYPRILIKNMLVNPNSGLDIYYNTLKIFNLKLTQYEDYTTLPRYATAENNEDAYCISIKPEVFMRHGAQPKQAKFNVNYSIQDACVSVYIDSMKVAKENAYPQVSYDIKINAINKNLISGIYSKLNSVCRINDTDLKFRNVRGYVSEIQMKLDEPWEDDIKIKNYKSKFEDLFSSIVASTENMKTNGTAYERAANSFTSTGSLTVDAIKDLIDGDMLTYNFNKGKLTISEKNGIWAVSDDGVVAFRSGGISVANEMIDGEWQWHTGITPNGINASLITAGQLNLDKIFIYAGDDIAYQMNANGLYAYRKVNDVLKSDEYVVHNGEGLFLTNENVSYINDKAETVVEDINLVEISWDGLILRNKNNEKVFYADKEGNLTLSGKIEASSGYIGGWQIIEQGLVSKDRQMGFLPNSEMGDALWIKGKYGDTFRVDTDGVVYGTSAEFTQSLIAKEVTVDGVPLSYIINKVGVDQEIFATSLLGEIFKVDEYKEIYPNELRYKLSSSKSEINLNNAVIKVQFNDSGLENGWYDSAKRAYSTKWEVSEYGNIDAEEWSGVGNKVYTKGQIVKFGNEFYECLQDTSEKPYELLNVKEPPEESYDFVDFYRQEDLTIFINHSILDGVSTRHIRFVAYFNDANIGEQVYYTNDFFISDIEATDVITVYIDSSAGDKFFNNVINTTLTCKLYNQTKGMAIEKEELKNYNFIWKKDNIVLTDMAKRTQGLEDYYGSAIKITADDVDDKAVFTVEVETKEV